MFDPHAIRRDFPILQRTIHGKPLVYLDSAATSQKPQVVIDAISEYYTQHNANVHRGVHQLSDESTIVWQEGRSTIANFFGADEDELILVRNTTEAVNAVVYGWAMQHLSAGDIVLTTRMEHHSNLVPWQEVCKRTGARVELIEVNEEGRLNREGLGLRIEGFGEKLKLIALSHVSNTLGTLNPIEQIVEIVHKTLHPQALPLVLVDGAQSAPHCKIDFRALGVDFFIFSGHKMLGPMGIGGLLIKRSLLASGEVQPWLFGGGMIEAVHADTATFHPEIAQRFTAGTPDVASITGLAAACRYLEQLDMRAVEQHDRMLVDYALEQLQRLPQITVVGPTQPQPVDSGESTVTDRLDRVGSVAFLYEGVHPHDVAQVLDSEGVAVRSGHHCTMPLHTHFGWPGTTRLSFQVYTTTDDIDVFINSLAKVKTVFGR